MSATIRAKRIRVKKEDIFRIAYCFTPLFNQAGDLESIRLYVKDAEGGDIIPASQIDNEYKTYYNKVVRATMYITKDKKVALDMKNKADKRFEFKIHGEENVLDKLDELMDRLIDHLSLPETTVPQKHQCHCRNTCLTDTLRVLYPYLKQASKNNLLKYLLFTRLLADPEIRKIIFSICGTESVWPHSPDVNMIGDQYTSLDVEEASADSNWDDGALVTAPNSSDISDDELKFLIRNFLQRIKAAEQRTILQDVEDLFRKYKMRMIIIVPAETLSLLEWMSIILNFRGSCLDTIKSLEDIIENNEVFRDHFCTFNPEETVTIYTRYADILLEANQLDKSKSWLDKALEIANVPGRIPELSVPVLFSLSLYHIRTGERNLATSKVSEALSIVMGREPKDPSERRFKKSQRATATGIQGQIAFRECKYEKAKVLLEEELSAYNIDDDDISVRAKYAVCLLRLCDALLNLSIFETALDYCERSHDVWKGLLRICGEGENLSHARIADCLERRGDHDLMTGHIVIALKRFHNARAMREKVFLNAKNDWHPAVSAADRRVSCAYLALGAYDKAELHFGKERMPVDIQDSNFEKLSSPQRMRKLRISSPLKQKQLNNPIYLREILEEYNTAMSTVKEKAYEQKDAYHMHVASTLQRVGDVALLLAVTGAESEGDRQCLLDMAEERYTLCLKVRKGSGGYCSPAIPAIAVTFDCLGKLFYYKGDLAKARQHFRSAQDLRIGKCGVFCDCRHNHPDVAASLVYLGAIDLAENKVKEGEANMREALNVYREAFRGWKQAEETDFLSGDTIGEGSDTAASTEPDHHLVVELNDIILKCNEESLGDVYAGDGLNGYVKNLIMLPYQPVLLV